MPLLEGFEYRPPAENKRYPFNLKILQSLEKFEFKSNVCVLVGENGSGKSTLLEALAAAINLRTLGSHPIAYDPDLATARELSKRFKLLWRNKIIRNGFFLRAEDFFGFLKEINRLNRDIQKESEELRGLLEEEGASDYAISLAVGSLQGQKRALINSYGDDSDGQSHGEGFLQLFKNQLQQNSLYILDEPEAALSPMRQLAFLNLLMQAEKGNSQFIIATHSPILMAYPHAQILVLEEDKISESGWEDLEHVKFTKMFLENPKVFLRYFEN